MVMVMAEMLAPSQCIQAVIDVGEKEKHPGALQHSTTTTGEVHVLLAVLLAPSATLLAPVPNL